jgi:hypothetical protein
MLARISLSWITFTVVLLVACSGCGNGGVSTTGGGASPVTGTASATADTAPATPATVTGQAQSGGGGGNGNSGGGGGSGSSGGGGGAQGAPLHIPSIIIQEGADLQTEYNAVVANVVTQCGGTLCVSVSKEGIGSECGATIRMNGTPVPGGGGTDSQGNQIITVPQGASIVLDGNAFGDPSLQCPSDQSAVTVFTGWFSPGKLIGGKGDGGAYDQAAAAITNACSGGSSCVTLNVSGGPNLCNVESQPGRPSSFSTGVTTDIEVLAGGTITLDGNADGTFNNCPSGNSGTPDGSSQPGDQSTPPP